jgi:selenocysteine lyase/cysteine desulfurase
MQRRDALRTSLAALLYGAPASAAATAAAPELPPAALLDSNPEAYWKRIRAEQFLLPAWRNFLNNGSLGVTPRRVLDSVVNYMTEAAGLIHDDYPRWGYETLDPERQTLAGFFGCNKDELAITHNATEGMSFVAAGLDLKAGDEVVMTNQEHPSGRSPWQRRAQRDGITVREVAIPLPPRDPGQLADLLISALGPRTRVLEFSGITSPTGLIFPMREICRAARAKGVLTVIDGAHMPGQIPFRLSELECDFWIGSPHKWLYAPAGSGLLYIRAEHLDRLWPTVVTGSWDRKELRAARFMQVGTNNRAIVVGAMAGLQLLQDLGPDRVYRRMHDLARRVRKLASERSYIRLITPDDDRMYGSLTTLGLPAQDFEGLYAECRKRRIWITGAQQMRISTHIHTRPEDLEAFFELLDRHVGGKKG